ncbi:MAG: CBS domain-containing protein [Thioalkalivibrio sp.]
MKAEDYRKPLPSFRAPAELDYVEPGTYERVSATAPAVRVMTNLRQVSAGTVHQDATLIETNQTMIARGVRLLLVVNTEDRIVGLITARDIQGERPIKLIHERGGRFEDLQVRDLMTPRESIDLIEIRDVMRAEVRDVVTTLKEMGRQHALVSEKDPVTGRTRICGIFSATQIGRQLGLPVQVFEVAKTFAEIQTALAKDY